MGHRKRNADEPMTHVVRSLARPQSLARRFADLVRRMRLFGTRDHILVAVSGGPDSVSLLSLLSELRPSWKLTLGVVHINHGLRGAESDADERFVTQLCTQLGVPSRTEEVSLPTAARLRKGRSVQEYAREVRYATLMRAARAVGASRIALGHTADDQAETVLMWMLRGSGMRGLAGIPRIREGKFVRPLLGFRRAELVSYLDATGLSYRQDSSNASTRYLRNRIRHDLLPTLTRFNPSVVDALCRQAEILREEDRYLDELTGHELDRLVAREPDGVMTLDRSVFLTLPLALQRRALRSLLTRLTGSVRGPSFQVVTDILDKVVHGLSGAALSTHDLHVQRDYEHIRFARPDLDSGAGVTRTPRVFVAPKGSMPLPIPSTLEWPLTGQRIRVWLDDIPRPQTPVRGAPTTSEVRLDADCFTLELTVRPWKPGDTFQPAGMHGHRKKLQDFFSDRKVPRRARRRIPLLVAPEGILWVVGYRPDQRFCATSSSTRILMAEVKDPQPA